MDSSLTRLNENAVDGRLRPPLRVVFTGFRRPAEADLPVQPEALADRPVGPELVSFLNRYPLRATIIALTGAG